MRENTVAAEPRDPGYPYGEFDALEWAKEFDRIFLGERRAEIDVDLMVGWFANAIMTGYDQGKNEEAAARRASDAQVAFRGLALKWAAHSGACCTFEDDNSVVVTRESCRCGPVERAAQEALGMFGRPDEYRAALAATPAPQPATPPLDVERPEYTPFANDYGDDEP